jgi:hypothetical protein
MDVISPEDPDTDVEDARTISRKGLQQHPPQQHLGRDRWPALSDIASKQRRPESASREVDGGLGRVTKGNTRNSTPVCFSSPHQCPRSIQ